MKRKRILAMMMVIGLLLSSSIGYAEYAIDGDLSYEEGGKIYVQTEKDIKMLEMKNKEIKNLKERESNKYAVSPTSYPDGEYLTLRVRAFEQENGYYCGPATVKQVEDFVNGTSYSQREYERKLGTTRDGTDAPSIARYLENNLDNRYTYDSIGTFDSWMRKVHYGMINDMPAVLDINTKGSSVWPYSVEGHFVNTSGFDTKNGPGVRVRITDPNGPGLGNRWYAARDVYNVNRDHWRQCIIW